ncbi:VOC family protein [Sphingomonas sp. 28-63-12]|uniref:VOC family protein n=1 Tax=Sphingomonas sp. 28-63-12 TaxID=1970434 RepID=UPI000BC4C4B2|nr:MAG: glyoxalase [Sphingomonas sp. 28-63-12]
MANPQGSFIWYELMTPDQDASKAFYDQVMAWSVQPEQSGALDYRMLQGTGDPIGGALKLTDEMIAGGARPGWLGYIYVDDVDASLTRIRAAGGKIMMPAHDMPGVGRFAMVTDPLGAPFYLMKPVPPADDPDKASQAFHPTAIGHVAWNELASSDHKAALGFYGDLFDYRCNEVMPMGEMGDYAFLDHHGTRIGAMMTRKDSPNAWTFYFRVASVSEAKAAITAAGGTVMFGPTPVPGGDHVVIAMDPHGAVFGIVGQQGA